MLDPWRPSLHKHRWPVPNIRVLNVPLFTIRWLRLLQIHRVELMGFRKIKNHVISLQQIIPVSLLLLIPLLPCVNFIYHLLDMVLLWNLVVIGLRVPLAYAFVYLILTGLFLIVLGYLVGLFFLFGILSFL